MRVETLILGRDDRLPQDVWDLVNGYKAAPFLAELADQVAVGGIDPQGNSRPVIGDGFQRRELRLRLENGNPDQCRKA